MNKRKIVALGIALIASIFIGLALFSKQETNHVALNFDKLIIDNPREDIKKLLIINETESKVIQDNNKPAINSDNNDQKGDKTTSENNDKTHFDKLEENSQKPSKNDQEQTNVKPQPKPSEEEVKRYVTINIDVTTLLTNKDLLKENKLSLIPGNGYILSSVLVEFNEGDNVFDILKKACQNNGISFEYSGSQSSAYIEGIGGIYEFDAGNMSGWTYYVNGSRPNVGCSSYQVKENDQITWYYVCSYKDKLS